MTVELRRGRNGDWPAVRALLAADGLPVDDLDAGSMSGFFVAVDAADRVRGAIGMEALGGVALLRSLVVAAELRGSGIGDRLVKRLESEAAKRGATELWLLTISARPFFLARGYADRARDDAPAAVANTREFSSLCPDNASLMSRSFSAAGTR